jgi:vacuolar-type H+-ATPase subunit E/Vma4
MKFLGLIVLVAFMVSAFGLPLTQEQVEESAPVVSELNDIQDLLAHKQALTEVNDKISDWFKMVWGKIVKFFKELGVKIEADWLKVKAWFDKVGLKIKEFFQKLFPKELGEKILAALKKAWAAIVKKFNETVGKYKDLIIKALVADFKVIVGEAAKLLSQLVEGIAKIITDIIKHIIGPKYYAEELMEVDASIKEYWEMFKKIVVAMFKEKEAEFEAMWVKYKPILKALLEKLKVDFLHGAKTLAIDLLGDLIKIIIGWGENVVLGNEEGLSNVDSKISEWFKKVWLKIKAFFDDLGVKIKQFFDDMGIKIKIDWLKVVKWFDDLGAKIKAAFDKVFPPELQAKILAALTKALETIIAKAEEQIEKYKTAIIHALIEDGKTIVAEARMLLTEIINGVAKFITDIIKKIIGEKFMMDDEIADNGIVDYMLDDEVVGNKIDDWFKEMWAKVKKFFIEWTDGQIAEWEKFAAKYKPVWIEHWKEFKTDLIKDGRAAMIDFLTDAVKIITDW